jgi:hypothetical protein
VGSCGKKELAGGLDPVTGSEPHLHRVRTDGLGVDELAEGQHERTVQGDAVQLVEIQIHDPEGVRPHLGVRAAAAATTAAPRGRRREDCREGSAEAARDSELAHVGLLALRAQKPGPSPPDGPFRFRGFRPRAPRARTSPGGSGSRHSDYRGKGAASAIEKSRVVEGRRRGARRGRRRSRRRFKATPSETTTIEVRLPPAGRTAPAVRAGGDPARPPAPAQGPCPDSDLGHES